MGGFFSTLLLVAIVGGVFLYLKHMKDIGTLDLDSDPNIFEQGERSVKLCEDEIMIRAYNCAQLKSVFLRMMKARGILTITNKRVIFHTIGVKNDEDFIHHEVPIQKISGITIQSGVASSNPLNAISTAFAFLPSTQRKKIFFLDIHSEGASGENGVITVAPTDAKGTTVAVPNYDMIPTSIVVDMANEIGAIISDIKELGDLGVDKWKQR